MTLVDQLRKIVPYQTRKKIFDMLPREKTGIFAVLDRLDRNSATIFDIGANVGDVSLYLLRRFPQATVFSFEPCTETFARLTSNLDKAGYGERSRPFQLGFFDRAMEGTLHVTSFHGANSMMELSDEYRAMNPHIQNLSAEQIPLVRLDDFTAQQGIDKIDLVKIDVEGVERQILEGGAATFSNLVDAAVIELSFARHPRESGEFIKLFSLMHKYGFAPAEIYDVEHTRNDSKWRLAQFDCLFRRYRPRGKE